MSNIIGTSCFVSKLAAEVYYSDYGYSKEEVQVKFDTNEISVGQPVLCAGERIVMLDGGKRYGVETS